MIKGKGEQSRERSSAFPDISVWELLKREPSGHLRQRSPTWYYFIYMLETKRNCFPFLWPMDRASDSRMTIGHKTVWEATKKVLGIGRLLQPLLCEKHVHTNHLTRTRSIPDLRKCNFCHSSPCSWSNYCAFIWDNYYCVAYM